MGEKKAEIELIAQQERLRLCDHVLEAATGHEEMIGERDVLKVVEVGFLLVAAAVASNSTTTTTAATTETNQLVDEIETGASRMYRRWWCLCAAAATGCGCGGRSR